MGDTCTTCSPNNEFACVVALVCGSLAFAVESGKDAQGKKFFQRQVRCGQRPSSPVVSLARRPSGWFVRALIRGKRDPRVCPQRRGSHNPASLGSPGSFATLAPRQHHPWRGLRVPFQMRSTWLCGWRHREKYMTLSSRASSILPGWPCPPVHCTEARHTPPMPMPSPWPPTRTRTSSTRSKSRNGGQS